MVGDEQLMLLYKTDNISKDIRARYVLPNATWFDYYRKKGLFSFLTSR